MLPPTHLALDLQVVLIKISRMKKVTDKKCKKPQTPYRRGSLTDGIKSHHGVR